MHSDAPTHREAPVVPAIAWESDTVPRAEFDALQARVTELELLIRAGAVSSAPAQITMPGSSVAQPPSDTSLVTTVIEAPPPIDTGIAASIIAATRPPTPSSGASAAVSVSTGTAPASMRADIDVLSSQLARIESRLTSEKSVGDRLTRIRDSLMEMHAEAMECKADKAELQRLELTLLGKSRPGSANVHVPSRRLPSKEKSLAANLAGTSQAHQYVAALAAMRGSPPRRANLSSYGSENVDLAPAPRRGSASAATSSVMRASSESTLHRFGGHLGVGGPSAGNVPAPAIKGQAARSVESLNWELVQPVAITPTNAAGPFSQSGEGLSLKGGSFSQLSFASATLLTGKDGRHYRQG